VEPNNIDEEEGPLGPMKPMMNNVIASKSPRQRAPPLEWSPAVNRRAGSLCARSPHVHA
jgi:hypothetical protein